MAPPSVTVAQVGIGYWGPNLLRNLVEIPGCTVKLCCDTNPDQLAMVQRRWPSIETTAEYRRVLDDPAVDAVVIATPAATHAHLATLALQHRKHVFVEKPLALSMAEAEPVVRLAEETGRALMVGHLLLYHPSVRLLKSYVDQGELGRILYVYAHRLNLGRVRQDENVMWSLAPHDISVVLHLLDAEPTAVTANGMCFLRPGIEDVAFLTMFFPGNRMAHCHVSWLDPHRIRRFTIVGEKKMAVFDDVEATEKVRIYDKGVDGHRYDSYGESLTLRFGDVYIPRVDSREPLRVECEHFLACIRDGRRPVSDGENGLRVLRVLEQAQRALDRSRGQQMEPAR